MDLHHKILKDFKWFWNNHSCLNFVS